MNHPKPISPARFFLSGGIFIAFNFISNLFELGFNWVLIRLPEGEYSTFWALFRIFFIITAPLVAIQLVLGKEISALTALGRHGAARYFASRALRYVAVTGAAIMCLGLAVSPLIAGFLRIPTVLPVVYVMLIIAIYSPIPVLYGIIQGLKKFATLGLVTICWGGGRFFLSLLLLAVFASGLDGIMGAVMGAALFTILMASLVVREIFRHPPETLEAEEIRRAFSFILPIAAALFSVTVMRGADGIFAKRFFAPGVADAYNLSTTVGSAFFTLSGIFMVMIPVVSEETTLQRNPIRFLFRSMAFTSGLSLAGILVAWFFPGLVMMIMSAGKVVPGAEPLIRIVGIMVLPASLMYLTANYFLARHIAGFLPVLMGGAMLQVTCILLFHATPVSMLLAVGAANMATLIGMLVYLWNKHRDKR
jgi:O-antigen/teichoic acid export membrane protein